MKTFITRYRLRFYFLGMPALLFFLTSCPGPKEANPSPIAKFEIEETQTAGRIYITDLSENAEQYFWDFGDGGTSKEKEPTYTFKTNGTYKISLRVTGAGGEDTSSLTITISNIQGSGSGTGVTGRASFFTTQPVGWLSIDITVDGSFAGTIPGLSFNGTPGCGANGTVTVTKKPGSYSYSAKSNTGITWAGNITISANGCLTHRLDFPSGYSYSGQVAFWTNQASGWSSIEVSIAGSYAGTINSDYFNVAPECGAKGTVSKTLREGTYTYSAKSNTGVSWSGIVNIQSNGCSQIKLGFPNTSSEQTGQVTFWTATNFNCGAVNVTLNGATRATTSYVTSGGAPACATQGFATFDLKPGNYNFTASCSNRTWSGSVAVSAGGCTKMQLTN